MGLERESKFMGVTKKIFVTPWESKRFITRTIAFADIQIARQRQHRISIGAIFGAIESSDAPASVTLEVFDNPSPTNFEDAGIALRLMDMKSAGAGVAANAMVAESFFPDGLLFGVGIPVRIQSQFSAGSLWTHTVQVWWRYENWS